MLRRRVVPVLGVEVAVQPAWAVAFAVVTAALAFLGLPDLPANESPLLGWILAAIGALILFASVLGHELVHALTARRLGLPTRPVTLFASGGGWVGLEEAGWRPAEEFLVAASGPLASALLAALLLALAVAEQLVGAMASLVDLAVLGAAVNGVLGLLNLVPAFPLDGGRMLRAALWRVGGDALVATRRATAVGRVVGWLAIGIGLVAAVADLVPTGISLVLIGWFLSRFATTAYRWEAVRRSVDGVRVGEVMERDAPTVRPTLTLDVFVDQYLLSGTGSAFAVADDGELAGTIDLDRARRVPRGQWPERRITDVMTPLADVRTARQDDPLWPAIERFERERLSVMPVLEEGRLVGVLTREGLLSVIRGRARLAATAR